MGYRFRQIIKDLSNEFTCGKYHMFNNNCNHFTNKFALLLLGKEIPYWILRCTDFLGYLCCCLPNSLCNGQMALESLIAEDKKMKEMEEGLYKT